MAFICSEFLTQAFLSLFDAGLSGVGDIYEVFY